jgi:hypothetical protein
MCVKCRIWLKKYKKNLGRGITPQPPGVIHCISCKKNCCHIKFGKKKWRFENKAKNNLETGSPHQDFVKKLYRFHKACYLVERYKKAWYTLHSVELLFHFFLNLKLRYFQNALIWQYVLVNVNNLR